MINRIFSDKYVNHGAVVGNVLLLLMYRFAYPFAYILYKLGLSPNQITTQSLVFTILAFFSLVYDEGWGFFCFFWGGAVLLDFCDGTVARMTNNISKSAFRYDHMSDLFKLSLIMLGTGLRYDQTMIWALALSATFCFMYFSVLNHEIASISRYAEKTANLSKNGEIPLQGSRLRDRNRIIAWVVKYNWVGKVFWNSYSALLTINGHTLLLFFLLPLGSKFATVFFCYLILVSLVNIRSHIVVLNNMKR